MKFVLVIMICSDINCMSMMPHMAKRVFDTQEECVRGGTAIGGMLAEMNKPPDKNTAFWFCAPGGP